MLCGRFANVVEVRMLMLLDALFVRRASGENTEQNSLHSSMRFDDQPEDDDEDFDVVARSQTDVHVHITEPSQEPEDVTDYPQIPYGHYETKNMSLFFEDGTRSVDFVLVWKDVIPSEDATSIVKQREHELKEAQKLKREVYEENLLAEGLEIERTDVNGEIHFIKIHAPLIVLRRYAEILKLRMPMKEVSNELSWKFH